LTDRQNRNKDHSFIHTFIDNPFFKEASIVDTQQAVKARRDPKGIIQLSDQIKKISDRMGKPGRN